MSNKGSDPHLSLVDDRKLHNAPKPGLNNYTTGVPLRHDARVSVRPWKPPGLSRSGLPKSNGERTSAVPATCKACRKISDERKSSDQEQHDDSNAIRISPAGPSVASPTLGTAGTTSRKIQYSGQSQHRQDPTISFRWKIQKPVGKRDSSVPAKNNVALKMDDLIDPPLPIQRGVIHNSAVPKKSAIPVQRRAVVKTTVTKVATVPLRSRGSRKTAGSEEAAATSEMTEVEKIPGRKEPALPIQRREIPEIACSVRKTNSRIKKAFLSKVPAPSIRRTGSTKTSVPHQVSHNVTRKTESRPEPSSKHSDPVHYISCDDIDKNIYGWGDERNLVDQICLFCEKDFSWAPQEVDEYKYEDQFELFDEPEELLRMLPSVDILPCGHAFHTECLQLATPEEQFISEPTCILCLSMA